MFCLQKLSQEFLKDIFRMGHTIAQAYHPAGKKVPRGKEMPLRKHVQKPKQKRLRNSKLRCSCRDVSLQGPRVEKSCNHRIPQLDNAKSQFRRECLQTGVLGDWGKAEEWPKTAGLL